MTTGATPATAILFWGGINHPFEDAAPALADILQQAGFVTRLSPDLHEALAMLRREPAALFVNYALRWSMTQDEKYAPDRHKWALHVSRRARAEIVRHVTDGGGLLGIHTASICFDDWPQWREVLGGAWQWGRSWHPAPGPVRVQLGAAHELTAGLDHFEIRDEVYSDLDVTSGVEVLAWAQAVTEPGARATGTQPALWVHHYGRGRAVYDALGHDRQSLQHPTHRQLLQRAALWACGKLGSEAGRHSCAM